MYEQLHHTALYLQNHPNLGGLITYLIALAESLAVIGTIVPGSVTMTAIGALVGTGVLPLGPTLLWAILGSFTGDSISYWVGYHFNERLRKIWPFTRWPNILTKGEEFFRKHGGKSVVIGRFAGPARSVVPLIAGLMRMNVWRFILAAVPSAVLWAVCYMLPGFLLGALSLELPPSTATKFILGVLGIIAISWLIFWLIHLSFKTIAKFIDKVIGKLWRYFESQKRFHWIIEILEDPRHPGKHHQLTIAVFFIITAIIALLIFISIVIHGFMTHWNLPTLELLRSIRNRTTDDIMVVLTILGDKFTLFAMTVFILIWLMWRRFWRAAMHFAVLIIGVSGVIDVVKHLYFSARPDGIALVDASSSFPSGHVALSTAFFGFLAVLIGRELDPPLRRIPYITAISLVALIGLSRLYLGAHWLTDVLGSLFIGLAGVLLITLLYRRKPTPHISPKSLSIFAGSVFIIVGTIFSFAEFHMVEDEYAPYWPAITLDTQAWWQHQNPYIPMYVTSRLAKPHLALNVQWLGTLDNIKSILVTQGWQAHPPYLTIKKTIYELSGKNDKHHVPLLPVLYQNEAPELVLTKKTRNKQLILQLWKSNITISDSNQPLWIGSINYYIPKKQLRAEGLEQVYVGATEELARYLKNYQTRTHIVSEDEQPSFMLPLKWDGKLLLVK